MDGLDDDLFMFTGSSTIPYSYDMGADDEYGMGYIELGVGTQPIMVFRIRPNTSDMYEKLIKVKSRSLELHSVALLIPLVIGRKHNDYIVVGFYFNQSLRDLINSGIVPPLFSEDNGEMDAWWMVQINNLLKTIIEMHRGCLYHGGLGNNSSYVMEGDSICIVTSEASQAYELRNPDCEKEDFMGLVDFLKSIFEDTGLRRSDDWADFIEGFSKFRIQVVKHHTVLKDGVDLYGYTRYLFTRVLNTWQLNEGNFERLKMFIEGKFPVLSEGWNARITKPEYQKLFNKKASEYKVLENISMLSYVENAMKHLEELGRKRGVIAKELNDMFPGLFRRLHTACADYCVAYPEDDNIFPTES